MARELSVSRLVNVQTVFSPKAAGRRGFGTLLILGDSSVLTTSERFRVYTSLDAVAKDFGVYAPEYFGAALYFGQSPRPRELMIGRWYAVGEPGELVGGALSDSEKTIGNWTQITAGTLTLEIDGTEVALTGLDFSAVTNLNGVANVVQTAIQAEVPDAVCRWNGSEFTIIGVTTGPTGSVSYADSADTLAAQMKLTETTAAKRHVGVSSETPVEAAARFADLSAQWYGLTFCATATISDAEHLEVAAFIEGAAKARRYGITIQSAEALDGTVDTDLGSRLKAAGYKRTSWIYSSHNPYAICSMFSRAFAVNFSGNRTTITLMYKQLPGVVYEQLTETEAQVLARKNGNVYVLYDNDTAILQYGVNADGTYFDELHGADWLADAVQVALYNLLYQSTTKIPQTDEGVAQLVNAAQRVLDQAVQNGFAAPGIWNADGFGTLKRGDRLDSGYYVYVSSVDDQDQSEREQRIAPPMQIAVKLAGAIHTADVIININR